VSTERRYFTTHEASHFLGVSLPTVVNWINAERLEAYRTPGGHRRISRDDLASFIRRHAMPMPPELSDAGAAARLLVVDGAPARLEASLALLRLAGYACVGASTAFGAGLAIGQFRPDLVLIDLSMRGVDGATVGAALRSSEATRSLPLLAVSGGRGEKIYERAMASGFADLVTRPLSLAAAKHKIEQALRAPRRAA
jgi:excisionase family DNA binding protein